MTNLLKSPRLIAISAIMFFTSLFLFTACSDSAPEEVASLPTPENLTQNNSIASSTAVAPTNIPVTVTTENLTRNNSIASSTAVAPTSIPVTFTLEPSPIPSTTPTNTPTRPPQCLFAVDPNSSNAKYGALEFLNIEYKDGKVVMLGCSDLPNGAILDVTLDVIYSSPEDSYVGVDTKAIVSDGYFTAQISPPNIQQYMSGPYVVQAWFRPSDNQPAEVLEETGISGENLLGQRVWQLRTGDYTLILSDTVDLPLEIVIPTYPVMDISSFPTSSPERALAEFLNAWQNEDWQEMANFSQITWKDGLSDPAEELMYMFGFKNLLGAEIISREQVGESWALYNEFVRQLGRGDLVVTEGSTAASVGAIIYYALNPLEVKKVFITPMIMREGAAYQPNPNGTWGVNPISAFDELELE